MEQKRSRLRNAWRLYVKIAVCIAVGAQRAHAAELSEIIEIIELVETKGWRADLGRICADFGLSSPGSDCIVKQISIQEIEGRGDPRGFNVPARVEDALPYVLIFHLSPLVGEFYVMSPQGEMLKAFYRAKGRGYEQVSIDEFHDEFVADLNYWKDNFTRIRAGIDSQPEQRR